jgi:predicted kinase
MTLARLLLITGAPGTGKTTLAAELARRLAAPLIAKDAIKEALFDRLGAPDASASRALSDASFAVMFALAREQLVAQVSFLMEGNFRVAEHGAVLRALLAGVEVRLGQVLCELPEEARRARLRARARDPARHAAHRDAELAAASSVSRAAWLDLPGERFTHRADDGEGAAAVLRAVERWWRAA